METLDKTLLSQIWELITRFETTRIPLSSDRLYTNQNGELLYRADLLYSDLAEFRESFEEGF